MALIYVRSGAASPTSPYTTWATAAATLQDAINNATPTNVDTIWVAPDHAESVGSSQTWVCPLTPGLRIMCAASNSVAPPTGLATTATISTTSNFSQTMTGFAYVYGLNFNTGASASNPILTFGTLSGSNPVGIILERCGLAILATGSGAFIQLGSTNATGIATATSCQLIDCTIRFSNVGQYMRLYASNIELQGMTFHASSSIPTTLFQIGSNVGAFTNVEVRGCDLTTKAFTNLVTVNGFQNASRMVVRNCLLPSGANIYTGTLGLPGTQTIRIHDCASESPYFNFAEHSALGVAEEETVVRRTDGAESSDTTQYSIKMSGSANATELYPLRSPEIAIWNDIIDTPLNVVMEVLSDRVTNLNDNEVWMEVAYHDDAGNSIYDYWSDGRATQVATATAQTTSTATWTTTGITNVRKQKLEVTIIASKVGFVNVRACLGLNTVVYVDTPTITE